MEDKKYKYQWKIVKHPTYEVTKYPHVIRFTGDWDAPIHTDRVIIEMDYPDAVAWINNTGCNQFQAIKRCINTHDITPSDWEILVGKDVDFLDSWSPRKKRID